MRGKVFIDVVFIATNCVRLRACRWGLLGLRILKEEIRIIGVDEDLDAVINEFWCLEE